MKKIHLGVCGLGTVASGVLNVFARNASIISARAGCELRISHVGARRDNSQCDTANIKVSRDIFDVVSDPDIDIVIELIGGTDVARDLVLQAIENGKHVVTANKALIAEHGNEILAAAAEKGVTVRFEAAVAGGIPVIKALTEGLSANRIQSIVGIINGTGNFILTEMRDKNRSFLDALEDAQQLGYAEADPTYDVEGIDAAQKLVILASLAYSIPFDVTQCYIEGISNVEVIDIGYAKDLGYEIKHLGIARQIDDGLELRVHPTLIPSTQLLAQVNGVMNAVFIKGDAVGPTLHYGAGAGAEPTASAVIADVIDVAAQLCKEENGACIETVAVDGQFSEHISIGIDDVECAFYLRVQVTNVAGVLAQVTQLLSEAQVSVEAMRQQDSKLDHKEELPIVLTTNSVKEISLRNAVAAIEKLDAVAGKVMVLRIESLS